MSQEVVPGVGFVLPAETVNLENTRGTTNAAPVAPAAAVTAPIFAAGEVINVRTRLANQQIRASLNVERDGATAAGFGTYRITDNGVAVGPVRIGPTGTAEQGVTPIDAVITIPVPGVHAIGAQVTTSAGAGDIETVLAGSTLVVESNEFV